MSDPGVSDWSEFALMVRKLPNGPDLADEMYRRIVAILDDQVDFHREQFKQEGTIDLDAIKFVAASEFLQNQIDPGVVAGLATAAIYRLARQK